MPAAAAKQVVWTLYKLIRCKVWFGFKPYSDITNNLDISSGTIAMWMVLALLWFSKVNCNGEMSRWLVHSLFDIGSL